MPITLIELPYGKNTLDSCLSARVFEFQHSKHCNYARLFMTILAPVQKGVSVWQ